MQFLTPSLPNSLVYLIRRIIHALSALSYSSTATSVNNADGKNLNRSEDYPSNGPLTPLDDSPIALLLRNPTLFSPLRRPRLPIVLCHGLYGFDVRGPSSFPKLQYTYWNSVSEILRNTVGVEVATVGVSGTGSIEDRAAEMDRYLQRKVGGKDINFIAHSMGGLDCRHLISHLKPSTRDEDAGKRYHPKSLITLSTPHHGSPFMDWCLANIGIGIRRHGLSEPQRGVNERKTMSESSSESAQENRDAKEQALNPPSAADASKEASAELPYSLPFRLFPRPQDLSRYPLSLLSAQSYTPRTFSLPTLLLSLIDSPAYSNLTTSFLKEFNRLTLDDPSVKYMSVACRKDRSKMGILHPLWFPKVIVDGVQERQYQKALRSSSPPNAREGNDGLVPVSSAQWGEFLGVIENCDHWEIRGAGGMGKFNFTSMIGETLSWGEWRKNSKEDGSRLKHELHDSLEKARNGKNNGDLKALTDRLSAVVDWIVDRDEAQEEKGGGSKKEVVQASKESKLDLKRFYVGLCRKLYDEGF